MALGPWSHCQYSTRWSRVSYRQLDHDPHAITYVRHSTPTLSNTYSSVVKHTWVAGKWVFLLKEATKCFVLKVNTSLLSIKESYWAYSSRKTTMLTERFGLWTLNPDEGPRTETFCNRCCLSATTSSITFLDWLTIRSNEPLQDCSMSFYRQNQQMYHVETWRCHCY